MNDQADYWSRAARRYEEEFIDPFRPDVRNPLLREVENAVGTGHLAIDLGCGTGPLLPELARHFERVLAIDFAEGMLDRARQRCRGLTNIAFQRRSFADLSGLGTDFGLAAAAHSQTLPDVAALQQCLKDIHGLLRPGGILLGIVPAMDAVHYLTMLLLDRARQRGMPQSAARKNAAVHAEHELYDFAFGEFRYRGLVQHFWQPFEVSYRLRRARFRRGGASEGVAVWGGVRWAEA